MKLKGNNEIKVIDLIQYLEETPTDYKVKVLTGESNSIKDSFNILFVTHNDGCTLVTSKLIENQLNSNKIIKTVGDLYKYLPFFDDESLLTNYPIGNILSDIVILFFRDNCELCLVSENFLSNVKIGNMMDKVID